jgi:uncharacterized BrkB/YihY/UPF0761 family membrane protein
MLKVIAIFINFKAICQTSGSCIPFLYFSFRSFTLYGALWSFLGEFDAFSRNDPERVRRVIKSFTKNAKNQSNKSKNKFFVDLLQIGSKNLILSLKKLVISQIFHVLPP